MQFADIELRRSVEGVAAIASASVLFWFGNDLNPLWPLLWFAPLPVLLFGSLASWWRAGLVAFLSILIGGLSMWRYLHVALHAPALVWLADYSVAALLFAAAVLLFRALLVRGAAWTALIAFPATWVSCEYVANLTTPNGTAGSLSYSQLNFLPFLQLASVTGAWGLTFLLLLFPAAIAIGLHLRSNAPRKAWGIVAVSLGVIGLVLIFGAVRLSMSIPGPKLRVGLIASDMPANVNNTDKSTESERLFREYAARAEALIHRGARMIVLPEKLGVIDHSDAKASDAIFQSLADRTGATIVAGVSHVMPSVAYNEARVYAPNRRPRAYHKHHLLPPFEDMFKPGQTLTLLPEPSGKCGIAICKDMDFSRPSRPYGKAGVGLMLVPAWDFGMDRAWHGHIAVMRGVEDGFSIARAAKQGYLTVSDDRGRILAETRSDSAPFATLIANVPVLHRTTAYLLLGDWFAWLALAALGFAIVQLVRLTVSPSASG